MAERRELGVTYQVLFRLERGQIKHPGPDVMRAVAALYGLDYRVLVDRFVKEGFGVGAEGADETEGLSGTVRALEAANAEQREQLATVSKFTAAIAGVLCQDNDATAEALELWTQLSPGDRASIIEVMKGYRERDADGAHRGAEEQGPAAKRRRGAARGRRHPA
jgi:hypothetical protein